MALVPLEFNPPAYEYEESHLKYYDAGDSSKVSWPVISATLSVREKHNYPDLKEITLLNGDIFSQHSDYGYSVGQFHEFFLGNLPSYSEFLIGSVEVTLGEVTPLGIYLFDSQYDKHFDGGAWEGYCSVRIYGAQRNSAELLLLNGLIRYHEQTGFLPELQPVRMLDYIEIAEQDETQFRQLPPACREIEPTRFYYLGLAQTDDASACIYFYRVLEYFAFLSHQSEVSRLRHDNSFSEREFLMSVSNLLTRDERGPVLRLIEKLSNNEMLRRAADQKLISAENSSVFGAELYQFRNSIIHAKHDQGKVIFSESIIPSKSSSTEWREILRMLAWSAIQNLGEIRSSG